MKKLLLLTLFLAACSTEAPSEYPEDATQSEINMATQMNITVEELRAQTPEAHMKMMQEMQVKSAN
ncbi:hypothetical protein COU75_01435 [Candidatus Peregrinibacteria bacterium CG10_big_fil_rev_8_21_14_0_10_42_8]|nr:MAG: hypothetical protein COU75_01435 [Candidatus Peregrinibacteria bacterium CG10_big_fil_rev_8_21_14_0_10_42_8]